MKIANGIEKNGFDLNYFSRFKGFLNASSSEDYHNKIKSMNLVDLCNHALSIGILPNRDRKRMEKLLMGEFVKASSNYKAACLKRQTKKQ